jgi:hypothetical protein
VSEKELAACGGILRGRYCSIYRRDIRRERERVKDTLLGSDRVWYDTQRNTESVIRDKLKIDGDEG